MKKLILFSLFISIFSNALISQVTNNRIRFKYRISKKKLERLNELGYFIADDKGKHYHFCDKLKKPFKCLITSKDSILTIDPWGILDSRTNNSISKNEKDPCYSFDSINVINAKTPNKLKIVLKPRNLVGNPTTSIKLPYQTFIISVNIIGLKIRPSIKDYNDSAYSANASTGTFNLGVSIGYSFGITKFNHRTVNSWALTPGLSFGFSSTSLSKEPLKRKITTTYTPSNLILSPCASLIVSRNDIGIIFTYGRDFMSGRHSDDWAYQGKGFFGIGIVAGLKLF